MRAVTTFVLLAAGAVAPAASCRVAGRRAASRQLGTAVSWALTVKLRYATDSG
ncbi:hypothetical protein Psuf_011160 [Phytohabitans suffuscus]|uniref:Uncharacterized protein n=2 Tax=Phytohabitans suffuscus TaxID=624315 RepID=A0A6F8YCP6_9ACTN|nr:hypothetical protein Psuf_011160 [Phytohabitans suffuscus]